MKLPRTSSRPALWTAALGTLLFLGASGCGETGPGGPGGTQALTGTQGPAFLPLASLAEVAHAGERTVEVWDHTVTPAVYTGFRESVLTDGEGRFSIDPVAPLGGIQSGWPAFRDMQRARAGYVFRYRDFSVRDQRLFTENYTLVDLATPVEIAGRTALRYRVERRVGAPIAFELAVDESTNLVLESRAYDESGNLLKRVRYESFDDSPDLSGAIWHGSTNQEQAYDWRRPLAQQIGVHAPTPRLLPPGYELRGAATVSDSVDRWLKLTYLDGVEPLFFMVALPPRSRSSGSFGTQVEPMEDVSGDEVFSFRMGSAGAVQGTVGGQRYMAVGKVSEDELLDLIESALP